VNSRLAKPELGITRPRPRTQNSDAVCVARVLLTSPVPPDDISFSPCWGCGGRGGGTGEPPKPLCLPQKRLQNVGAVPTRASPGEAGAVSSEALVKTSRMRTRQRRGLLEGQRPRGGVGREGGFPPRPQRPLSVPPRSAEERGRAARRCGPRAAPS